MPAVASASAIVLLSVLASSTFGQTIVSTGSVHWAQLPQPYVANACLDRAGAVGFGGELGVQQGTFRFSIAYTHMVSLEQDDCVVDLPSLDDGTAVYTTVRGRGTKVLRYPHVRLSYVPPRLEFMRPHVELGIDNELDAVVGAGLEVGSQHKTRWSLNASMMGIRTTELILVHEFRDGELVQASSAQRPAWRAGIDLSLRFRIR